MGKPCGLYGQFQILSDLGRWAQTTTSPRPITPALWSPVWGGIKPEPTRAFTPALL
jgi:hypothetical protein